MANIPFTNLSFQNPFSKAVVDPNVAKKDLRHYIAPVQLQRLRQDVQSWREVLNEAENVWFPHRVKAQRLYIDTKNNGHVAACISRRKNLTLLRKCEFVNKAGELDDFTQNLFLDITKGQSQNKEWFNRFLKHSLDTIFFGYTLITLGDIVNDSFPNIDIVKRWNVSPDRLNVTNFIYSLSGAQFMDEPCVDWHVYLKTYNDIGTSPSGYGLLYQVAIYEIYLRNLMSFNADFVELYAQPFRVGKTTKTDQEERAEFAEAIQSMGSNGWALIDPEDEIDFLDSALGGTGFNAYDNLEKRCEAKVSKIILGHADAIDSTPGKLGNSGVKSPAEIAMADIQTEDGAYISNVINNELIPKMRRLGFLIPDDVKCVFKNDAEIEAINVAVINQAVEMKKGGLQMDAKYFTDKTGIPVAPEVIPPMPPKIGAQNAEIKNKLDKIYNKHKDCNHS